MMHIQVEDLAGHVLVKVPIKDFYRHSLVMAEFPENRQVDGHEAVTLTFEVPVRICLYSDRYTVAGGSGQPVAGPGKKKSFFARAWDKIKG